MTGMRRAQCDCGLDMKVPAAKEKWLVEIVQYHSAKHHKTSRPSAASVKKMLKKA
ncbi:MAG: hypothetical protein ACHQX1_03300 [Candidatus Micrarchaeales archaeon]